MCHRAGSDKLFLTDRVIWSCLSLTTIALVFLSILFTDWDYTKSWLNMGAGTLVPITGFANSVAAPAVEYKGRSGIRYRL